MFRLNLWTQNPWGFPPAGYPPPGCLPPPLPPLPHPGFPPWMESSTSLPSPLGHSPALMVLATTAEAAAAAASREGTNKSQGTTNFYNSSQNGAKNPDDIRGILPITTTATYHNNGNQQQSLPMFAPPTVLPSHLAYPQFVRPDAEQTIISPSADGAFKSLSKLDSDPGSAFVAVKKPRLEDFNEDGQKKTDGTTEDAQKKEDTGERPDSVGSRSSEGLTSDESRTLRREYIYLHPVFHVITHTFCND